MIGSDVSTSSSINVLLEHCSEFIAGANGSMLYRGFESGNPPLRRVKVRKKKAHQTSLVFNEAFDDVYPGLIQRSILANGNIDNVPRHQVPHYVFPIDGFKFMYNTNIINSKYDTQDVLDTIYETSSSPTANSLVADVLKFTYTHTELVMGINSGAEVVIYNIPTYFALVVSDTSKDVLSKMGIL